jgi:hypothetical protein
MASSHPSASFENGSSLGGIPQELLSRLPDDPSIWESLKQAIAASSGFQRWQLERNTDGKFSSLNLDIRVRSYLRETLETLAY